MISRRCSGVLTLTGRLLLGTEVSGSGADCGTPLPTNNPSGGAPFRRA